MQRKVTAASWLQMGENHSNIQHYQVVANGKRRSQLSFLPQSVSDFVVQDGAKLVRQQRLAVVSGKSCRARPANQVIPAAHKGRESGVVFHPSIPTTCQNCK